MSAVHPPPRSPFTAVNWKLKTPLLLKKKKKRKVKEAFYFCASGKSSLLSSGSREGARGPPFAPKISSKSCSFQATLRENPNFEQILGSGPPLGVKTPRGLPLTKILDPRLLLFINPNATNHKFSMHWRNVSWMSCVIRLLWHLWCYVTWNVVSLLCFLDTTETNNSSVSVLCKNTLEIIALALAINILRFALRSVFAWKVL